MGIYRKTAGFLLGGTVYVGLEYMWRGRSHLSMFAAGGLCLVLVGHLGEVEPKLPLYWRVLTGTAIITMVELGTGLLVNREYKVWDYRDQPGNLWGQICPQYCLLWLPLSWLATQVYEKMQKVMV